MESVRTLRPLRATRNGLGNIMKRTCLVAAGAAVLIGLAGTPALVQAQETGLASIHSWVAVGRKTCMETHTHDGNGTGKTKKDAEKAAIQSWESFTAWEYGSPWGRYSESVSKTVNCDKTTTSEFSCHVNSRPCKSSRSVGVRKAKSAKAPAKP
jgi:hypothetical protein